MGLLLKKSVLAWHAPHCGLASRLILCASMPRALVAPSASASSAAAAVTVTLTRSFPQWTRRRRGLRAEQYMQPKRCSQCGGSVVSATPRVSFQLLWSSFSVKRRVLGSDSPVRCRTKKWLSRKVFFLFDEEKRMSRLSPKNRFCVETGLPNGPNPLGQALWESCSAFGAPCTVNFSMILKLIFCFISTSPKLLF